MLIFKKRPPRDRIVETSDSHLRQYRRLISGGLAGFSGVCVTQMLGIANRDMALNTALYCFAIAIPLLVRDLMDAQAEERRGLMVDFDARFNQTILGIMLATFGIGAIFWHFSLWMTVVFGVVCIYSLSSHSGNAERLWEANRLRELKGADAEEEETEEQVE